VDRFVGFFKSVSDEFDCYVSVFLGGVFHPVTTIFRRCFDKMCRSCDMAEKVGFLSAFYDAIEGKLVAEVNCECCQVFDKSLTYVTLLRALRPDVGEWVVSPGLGM